MTPITVTVLASTLAIGGAEQLLLDLASTLEQAVGWPLLDEACRAKRRLKPDTGGLMAGTATASMSVQDALWLTMDRPNNLMVVDGAMVLRGIPYWLGLLVIVMALLVLDRRALLGVDWGLLVTFAAFFTFSGNMARIEPVRELFRKLLTHGAMPVAALTSQVISNVPAAILLSRFTDDYRGLLVGVNIGGAGTLVASLASLITFREYTKHVKGQTGRFMVLFSAISFGFLGVLLVAMTLWMR